MQQAQETKEVNGYWFVSTVSQMVLNYQTGMTHSQVGSPFAQFRKQFPLLPKNKKKALLWVEAVCIESKIKIPTSLQRILPDLKA